MSHKVPTDKVTPVCVAEECELESIYKLGAIKVYANGIEFSSSYMYADTHEIPGVCMKHKNDDDVDSNLANGLKEFAQKQAGGSLTFDEHFDVYWIIM